MTQLLLASALMALQALAQAVPATEQARRDALKNYTLGQEALAREQFEGAVGYFRRAIALDEWFTDAHYGLGQARMGLREYAAAVDAFEDCLEAARTIHSLRERDRVGADQRINDQIRTLREALISVRKQKTGQIENQVLQIEARIRELERSRSSNTGAFEPPAEVLLALGSAHFRQGHVLEAREHWEQAVKVNAKLGQAWNNLAVAYLQEGRKADAEAAVHSAERAGFRVNPRLKDDIARLK